MKETPENQTTLSKESRIHLKKEMDPRIILSSETPLNQWQAMGGGKAKNLGFLSQNGFLVPKWFCISEIGFDEFLQKHNLLDRIHSEDRSPEGIKKLAAQVEFLFTNSHIPVDVEANLLTALDYFNLRNEFVAVRSSGLDEDSAEHSFAGQFSSYLYQKGPEQIIDSIKQCWASGFSERALAYRLEKGLPLDQIRVGVVIQKMVNAECAGVGFSRNPIHPLDRDHLIVSSVWGLGEGLVSGELDADHFTVNRSTLKAESKIVPKPTFLLRAQKGGVQLKEVPEDLQKSPSISDSQLLELSRMLLKLEDLLGNPQDTEWAIEENKIYLVQTRPITNLPCEAFFDPQVNGSHAILWDNSNIIESYSGVTSPLTFSFASSAYRQVYIQFCELMGVPRKVIEENEPMYRNMLGILRGRIYYNLVNWYKLVLMLPGSGKNKGFMETMMGVRQSLKPEMAHIFDELKAPVEYSRLHLLSLHSRTFWRFMRINSIVSRFRHHFDSVYEANRKTDFESKSLTDLAFIYQELDHQILRKWQAPIINDYLCMIFFGLLKKLTENWIEKGDSGASLQNDLLCGQGELESTEPTKRLMKIAARIDNGSPEFRQWFIETAPEDIWSVISAGVSPFTDSNPIVEDFLDFLDRYGFRCVNELKLEEPDLHDDPSFALGAIASYVKMKSYCIEEMEKREAKIKLEAEKKVKGHLPAFGKTLLKRMIYFWVLKQARKAVKNRENLRFARTKIFGIARHLFRGMGTQLVRLGQLEQSSDIFYLKVEEILESVEGRSSILNLKGLIALRKKEYDEFRKTLPPPDRLTTQGAACVSISQPQVLSDADLLQQEVSESDDPNVLLGTPCCPGVIEGTVRVVNSLEEAKGLSGEILVTSRTDPGWVPLYPSCSGLLIERGSLLSHSAVVARELGLPTIVGVSGGLMTRLKTGQKVRIDAGKGEVRILE